MIAAINEKTNCQRLKRRFLVNTTLLNFYCFESIFFVENLRLKFKLNNETSYLIDEVAGTFTTKKDDALSNMPTYT